MLYICYTYVYVIRIDMGVHSAPSAPCDLCFVIRMSKSNQREMPVRRGLNRIGLNINQAQQIKHNKNNIGRWGGLSGK